MPTSAYGCGTKYYGERDFHKDGSYLTTNFFAILFFPLIPLHTVRVIPDPKNLEWSPIATNHYLVLEKRAPDLLQVASVYFSEAVVIALMIAYLAKVDPFLASRWPWLTSPWVAPLPFFLLTVVLPMLGVRILRNKARKRAFAEDISNPLGNALP
jgi:hypothetical protein